MYPSRFRYEAPRTLEEAIAVLAAGEGEAKVLAGGQSLVPMMKLRFANPALLVDINNLPGLDYHRTDADGTLRVGALCRHATIEHSELVASTQPTMAAAAHLVADPIVRNRGTFVGSLCHADPQGDWAAVLTALDGSVVAQGPGGRRTLGIRDFVVGPFQTAMSYDEARGRGRRAPAQGARAGGYLKLERRVGDFATAGCAVALETQGGQVNKAGIAPHRRRQLHHRRRRGRQSLVGQALTAESIARAAELAAAAARPNADHRGSAAYKRRIVGTFVTRILTRIAGSTERAA
ncbi:MAG: FAD binding domain-containing protein [Nocardioides sp.]